MAPESEPLPEVTIPSPVGLVRLVAESGGTLRLTTEGTGGNVAVKGIEYQVSMRLGLTGDGALIEKDPEAMVMWRCNPPRVRLMRPSQAARRAVRAALIPAATAYLACRPGFRHACRRADLDAALDSLQAEIARAEDELARLYAQRAALTVAQ